MSLYRSSSPETLGAAETFLRPSLIGTTGTALARSAPGIWDRGPALRISAARGGISSATFERVLGGANAMAIGLPDGPFEVFQFAEAVPVEPGVWDLSIRLRGQAGTDAVMPDLWPVGSTVVLLDGAPQQVGLSKAMRGRPMHYRYGPSSRPPSDEVFVQEERAFDGEGLRPLAPVHLRCVRGVDGAHLAWVRRTRFDGDDWGEDVPLNEAREAYRIRVVRGDTVLRQADVAEPAWTYDAVAQSEDGDGVQVEVAQLSEVFGPGRWAAFEM